MEELKQAIRDIPDFPQKGVIFKDITTLLQDPAALKKSIDVMGEALSGKDFDLLLGIESRGFIFGSALAYNLGKGFIIARKPGKLPANTVSVSYDLEYGTDSVEIHEDAIRPGQKVVIVDDLLATGGTAKAVAELVEKVGGKVASILFLVELDFLKGGDKLKDYDTHAILHYS